MAVKTQADHASINAREYPGTRQLCVSCDAPTDRCEEDAIYDDKAIGPLCEDCYHETPKDELIRQLLDSRISKTEREWVGGREIKRLRGIIARNARTRLSGDDGPLFVTPRDIKESLEILYAEMEREDSPNAKVTDESPK